MLLRNIFIYLASLFLSLIVSLLLIYVYFEAHLPDIETLKDIKLQEPLRIYTSDNKLIAEFGEKRRIPVALKDIPPKLIQAILATEDQRFYEHSGVDLVSLVRASLKLISTGSKSQGASTITMQVARNFFFSPKKTYIRKINEILLAIKIDKEFSKDKILELYLNKIYFGHGAYGVATAAEVYYGKTLNELTLAELALIAGLPQAPSKINPVNNPKAALKRRNYVLFRMYEENVIDKKTYEKALYEPINSIYHKRNIEVYAPHVAEMIREVMYDKFGENAYSDGYKVYATISGQNQKYGNHALESTLMNYDKRFSFRGPIDHIDKDKQVNFNKYYKTETIIPGIITKMDNNTLFVQLSNAQNIKIIWKNNAKLWPRYKTHTGKNISAPKNPHEVFGTNDVIYVTKNKKDEWEITQQPTIQGALISLSPIDGHIEALVGGFSFEKSNYNRVTQAFRQPGSSFKPFIYAAGLEKEYTLATIINDAPIVKEDPSQPNYLWIPKNHTGTFLGPTRFKIGLAHSRNLVSIRILESIGTDYAVDYISKFGFQKKYLPNSLSLALGTASVTPLQLASAYCIFANGGYKINPYIIKMIVDKNNKVLFEENPKPICIDCVSENNQTPENRPTINPQVVYLINSAMREVILSGTAQAAKQLGRQDIAGKTGSTNNHLDAWFAGFTPLLTTVTWVGFDKPTPINAYAAATALPMWIDFMGKALKDLPEKQLPEPEGLIHVKIDPRTGLLANSTQTDAFFETFIKGTAPVEYAPINSDETLNNESEEPKDDYLF